MTNRYVFQVHDKFYDLTSFLSLHPGGKDVFVDLQSLDDITPMVYAYHKHPTMLFAQLKKYETSVVDFSASTASGKRPQYNYELYLELKKEVVETMNSKNIPFRWCWYEQMYNTFTIFCYIGLWTFAITVLPDIPSSHAYMVFLAIFSMGDVALIFHETSHHVGFKNQTVNRLISSYILVPVATIGDWRFTHNYLHHSFTNTLCDPDFESNKFLFRHCVEHPKHVHHRFQHIYASFLFFFTLLVTGPVKSLLQNNWSTVVTFSVIVFRLGISRAMVFYATSGFIFAIVTQLSHIQNECVHLGKKSDDFLCNQVCSSMNYRTDTSFFARFISFGLDIQIEHHLFPNIPHSSLRKIQPVVRSFCEKHGIPYRECHSIIDCGNKYFRYLFLMGSNGTTTTTTVS